jgi:hypothetical protein
MIKRLQCVPKRLYLSTKLLRFVTRDSLFYPDDGDHKFLRNVGTHVPNYTSHPRMYYLYIHGTNNLISGVTPPGNEIPVAYAVGLDQMTPSLCVHFT